MGEVCAHQSPDRHVRRDCAESAGRADGTTDLAVVRRVVFGFVVREVVLDCVAVSAVLVLGGVASACTLVEL